MRQYHLSYFHRQILADVTQFNKQIIIWMYIRKTYIDLCRVCAILYTYMYFVLFFVKRPCIATTASHCAQGFTLVQNKSCMNLLFLLTWIIHMSIHILFQSARKKLRWQSEFCSKKAIHTASKCGCQSLYVQKQAGSTQKTLLHRQFGRYQALLLILHQLLSRAVLSVEV